jgi:5-methylcytosine-specific restriction endonuclease McrA
MLLNTSMGSTLVLAPDYQPVSYLPLSTISWQMAIKLFFLDKVTVLEWHDDWIVHSAKLDMRVPAVIVAKRGFNRSRGKMKFSRQNLYLRDLYTCQYCEDTISGKNLTLDHVIPISRGGKTTWENSVTACRTCNIAKGSSKGWQPIKTPIQPDYWRLVSSMKNVPLNVRHPSWQKYIGVKEATVIRRSA